MHKEMGSGNGKMVLRNLKSFANKYLTVAFVLGFLLVLFSYLMFSEQFALSAPNAYSNPPPIYQKTPAKVEEKISSTITQIDVDLQDGQVEEKKEESKLDLPKKKDDDIVVVHEGHKEKTSEPDEDVMIHEAEKTGQEENGKREEELQRKNTVGGNHQDPPATVTNDEKEQTKDTVDSKHFGGAMENTNQAKPSKPICDVENPVSDTCNIEGDVRIRGANFSVVLVPPSPMGNAEDEWKIRPYSRKNMASIKEVVVKQLGNPQEAAECSIKENTPAVVFALGGLIGNYWHDFSDVLVPLFIASRQFDGEVQFLISNIQPWWLDKYDKIVKKLSKYEMINFDKDLEVRCYSHVIVGLRMHKEFSINPEWAPRGYSMANFTELVREAYSLPRGSPIKLSDNQEKKPRLLLIDRGHYRKFTNVPEIVQLAEKLGFETVVIDPKWGIRIEDFSRTVNSFDVLLGVHGAALTNAVFLPANAVVIQVVPYGNLERMAKADFGDPIVDMKLKYIEYSISAEESTLLEMFGKDHPIIKDPDSIHKSGWDKVAEYYLGKQDVTIDVNRFAPALFQALDHLRQSTYNVEMN